MAENLEKLIIEWRLKETDGLAYSLVCVNPGYEQLQAEISADAVTERAARAKLIAMVFERAREQGIDTSRLRFHV